MMLPQIIELASRTNNIKYLRLFFTSKALYACLIKDLYQRNSAIKLVIPQCTFVCITQCMFCGTRKNESELIHKLCEWDTFPHAMFICCDSIRCYISLCQSYFNLTIEQNKITIVPIAWVDNMYEYLVQDIMIPRTSGNLTKGHISCEIGFLSIREHDGVFIYTNFVEDNSGKAKWVNVKTLHLHNSGNEFLGILIEKLKSADADLHFNPYTLSQRKYITDVLNLTG
jgi:hypothetical protein